MASGQQAYTVQTAPMDQLSRLAIENNYPLAAVKSRLQESIIRGGVGSSRENPFEMGNTLLWDALPEGCVYKIPGQNVHSM
eukprot:840385-Pyramimonas_sp.AAC.1